MNRDMFLVGVCVALLLIITYVLAGPLGLIDPSDKPTLVSVILGLPALAGLAYYASKKTGPQQPPPDDPE